jgi:phosphatidylserine/phosphatidylglycerophosphate/cardiolipin synthase-like enzyme
MTCQYFPNNLTPAALANAHDRGVGVHLAYNHPSQHRKLLRGVQERQVAYKKKRLPGSVFENQLHHDKNYLHAKILLSEKEAIIGSHNFVKLGVNWGTAEIALHSTSQEFISRARTWIQTL